MVKQRTASEYLQIFNKVKNTLLRDGENAAQMVNHNPMYFITDRGRIFSLAGKKPRELSQVKRAAIVAKGNSNGNNCHKATVSLRVNNTTKLYYVHRIVAEYFSHKTFVPEGYTGNTVIHHICGYNPDNLQKSNHVDNLSEMPNAMHRVLHDMPFEPSAEWTKSFNKQIKHYLTEGKKIIGAFVSENGNERTIEYISPAQLAKTDTKGEIQQCIKTLSSLWVLAERQQEENERLKKELHEQTNKFEQEDETNE